MNLIFELILKHTLLTILRFTLKPLRKLSIPNLQTLNAKHQTVNPETRIFNAEP
jgi:hypothetical protein